MGHKDKLPAVLGVGNALVDIITMLENDAVLGAFNLPRGSMTLVDAALSEQIYSATNQYKREMTTGGSAANTIRSLASLGGKCGYLGKTGDDELGRIFKEEFRKKGIKTHLALSDKDTGRVMGLVSTDSERTMATYLGAAADLIPTDFNSSILSGYKYLYMEGYLVQNHELIKTGFEMAKAAGLKTAIDLASFNVVEANLDFLKHLIKESVDIVFANEEEAYAFIGKSPEKALEEIAAMCELAVVKVGKDGSFIQHGKEKIKVGSIKAKAVDTTGAGDSYAAGFLYGLTRGFDLEKCGNIATLVSGKVVEVLGANLPADTWKDVNREIERM
jgi:sugar/nucleoside kinase (ribokinase family)